MQLVLPSHPWGKGVLADPVLELYDSYGTLLESNDNWRSTQEMEIQATSIPPTDNREAALVITLAPGAYSTIVRGANSAHRGCPGGS